MVGGDAATVVGHKPDRFMMRGCLAKARRIAAKKQNYAVMRD